MPAPFVRQLGSQPGTQLNPIRDNSDGFVPSNADQVFAMPMRASRGRIDRPFKVNRGNFERKLGGRESIRLNALNEAKVQAYEALNGGGALEAVIHRMVNSTNAKLKWIVASLSNDATPALTFALSDDLPVSEVTYLFALRHLECFNDGISLDVHADAKYDPDDPETAIPNDIITIKLRDPSGAVLFTFTGSLDPAGVDDYGQSNYLPDIVEAYSTVPDVEVVVKAGVTSIPVAANIYGRDPDTGGDKVVNSGVLLYFTEGDTQYDAADYALVHARLMLTEYDYGYIGSGGSQATPLLANLAQLAFDVNTQFRFDIDGTALPAEAIAFRNSLGFDSYYCQAFWAPLKSDDPFNGGKAVIGTSGFNIARACLRNAAKDANGFAAKNQPIAGVDYPLARTGVKQLYTPDQYELSDLADAQINPVIFEVYNGGGKFVFTDSLTCAKTKASLRKLISTAEMSSSIDDIVVRFTKEALQRPMETAVSMVQKFCEKLFEGAETAKWIKKSADLAGAAWVTDIRPNEQKPVDNMDVNYSLHYDGVARQITVTQTISR